MDILKRMSEVRQRNWPVGNAEVQEWERAHGHDDEQYSPESYGDYVVTSNEVYSVAMMRARLAATVPLKLYRGRTEDKEERPDSAPAKLLRYVNPFWTPARLARMDSLCMDLWGETYWAIEKDALGMPREIWWLKPSRVKPVPHPEGYLAGFLYESSVNGQVIPFKPDEIVWQRHPNPLEEFSALSPVAAARLAADTASAMMKANNNLHKQGLQIAGIVSPKTSGAGRPSAQFSRPQADELADMLEKRFSGAEKAHKWAVLRFEAQFAPANMSPKDAEFIDGLGLTLRQVCNAYNMPSPLFNDLEHATLANLREFQKAMWEHSLKPDLELRAQDVEAQYLPLFGNPKLTSMPDYIEPDFSGVGALQEAKSATWDRDRQALEVGAITINEWRKKQGMPEVPWGDVFWAPVNKGPVTDAEGESSDSRSAASARNLVEMVQKVYLGVGSVLSASEARELLNRAGADLPADGGLEPPEPAGQPEPTEIPAPDEERIMREFMTELSSFRLDGSKR